MGVPCSTRSLGAEYEPSFLITNLTCVTDECLSQNYRLSLMSRRRLGLHFMEWQIQGSSNLLKWSLQWQSSSSHHPLMVCPNRYQWNVSNFNQGITPKSRATGSRSSPRRKLFIWQETFKPIWAAKAIRTNKSLLQRHLHRRKHPGSERENHPSANTGHRTWRGFAVTLVFHQWVLRGTVMSSYIALPAQLRNPADAQLEKCWVSPSARFCCLC